MATTSSSTTRRRPKVPVGLQVRQHGTTGEPYWAVVAVQAMHTGSVDILRPYETSWQRRPKGDEGSYVTVSFIDELQPSTPPDLAGRTVYVTRDWLESCFLEPSWEEFERSDLRVLGASVGIMTGLLPPAPSVTKRATPPNSVPESLGSALPLLLVNVGLAVAFWLVARYAEKRMSE